MQLHHTGAVVSVHFSADGSRLLAATTYDGITLWDVTNGTAIFTSFCSGNGASDALLVPNGQQLFEAGVAFGDSFLIDLQTKDLTTNLETIQGQCAAWVPGERGILLASWDDHLCGAAQLLDRMSLDILHTYSTGIEGMIVRLDVSQDGTHLLLAQDCFSAETDSSDVDAAFLFETDTGVLLHMFRGPTRIFDIAFASDEQQVVACCESGLIWWDVETTDVVGQHPYPRSPITSLAFDSTGQVLACGCEDGAVVVWQWPELHEIAQFYDHTSRVNQIAFAPRNWILASASEDATVSLRQLSS